MVDIPLREDQLARTQAAVRPDFETSNTFSILHSEKVPRLVPDDGSR